MQEDMHYYGTYAMARAAGIEKNACTVIATAAQFVDDHAHKEHIKFNDGARIDTEATAHHSVDLNNLNHEDQRMIWVPFHFLPGVEGNTYGERMVCRKNSVIAKTMVDHNLSLHDKPFALLLMGITAHVYADTFSHHGFSGFGSKFNKVDQHSFRFRELGDEMHGYITAKADRFFNPGIRKRISRFIDRMVGNIADDLSSLGHGGVATYPDRPYLKWSFKYEWSGERVERNNPEDFLEGCEALHDMFKRFAALNPKYADAAAQTFSVIKEPVRGVLAVQADMQGRIDAWQALAKSGKLFACGGESIPEYDQNDWHSQRLALESIDDSDEVISMPIYQFYQAAGIHRMYVLRDLLPASNLVAH